MKKIVPALALMLAIAGCSAASGGAEVASSGNPTGVIITQEPTTAPTTVDPTTAPATTEPTTTSTTKPTTSPTPKPSKTCRGGNRPTVYVSTSPTRTGKASDGTLGVIVNGAKGITLHIDALCFPRTSTLWLFTSDLAGMGYHNVATDGNDQNNGRIDPQIIRNHRQIARTFSRLGYSGMGPDHHYVITLLYAKAACDSYLRSAGLHQYVELPAKCGGPSWNAATVVAHVDLTVSWSES